MIIRLLYELGMFRYLTTEKLNSWKTK